MRIWCSSRLKRKRIPVLFFFSSRRRHTRFDCDWSSDVCSSDLRGRHLAASPLPPLLARKSHVPLQRSEARARALIEESMLHGNSEEQPKQHSADYRMVAIDLDGTLLRQDEIGRASCRERV